MAGRKNISAGTLFIVLFLSLLINNSYSLDVKINPMIELDFKTKAEIYELRKKHVLQYPQLIKGDYQPSEEVFGGIEDGRPWWGMLGFCYYGNGERSIEGLSVHSRFIVNPYLLVGLDEGWAYRVKDKKLKPKAIYPRPTKLIWEEHRSWAKVTYDVKRFWKEARKYGFIRAKEHTFDLIAYNARDLGFSYLYVDTEESKNIVSLNKEDEALFIPFMIHLGGSCGYPGGCNNMSPDAPEFVIKVKRLPAQAYIKLWRSKPETTRQTPDMVFIIEMR